VRHEIRQMTPGEANLSGTRIYVTRDKTMEAGPLGPTLLSDTTEPLHPINKNSTFHTRSRHCTAESCGPNQQHKHAAQVANQNEPPQNLIS
jgi:hypothetical protein